LTGFINWRKAGIDSNKIEERIKGRKCDFSKERKKFEKKILKAKGKNVSLKPHYVFFEQDD
jgi:hypothetical protein